MVVFLWWCPARGSSPLARGPRHFSRLSGAIDGLIPARAGTTLRRLVHSGRGWAHPRSRGDHLPTTQQTRQLVGSSPLARGPPRPSRCIAVRSGLIPARAGTTSCAKAPPALARAHPRSRGDHRACSHASRARLGSSPLARGPPRNIHTNDYGVGLIPARAGTTVKDGEVERAGEAHPRSRGDHSDSAGELHGVRGSSPLARGPRPRCERPPCHRGLIPARAGTTSSARRAHDIKRAHPRSRGDHGVDAWYAPGETGSSPLARGPHRGPQAHVHEAGLIPARAGTTHHRARGP